MDSCKEYVKTPIQTLDGIYVHQPQWFLLLTKEAKRLAEALRKEQVTSQWAGIPHEKLLQESFMEQLNSIQTLEQLVPLQAAKEHLPQDIINILELLGKADNIPLNQLYSLAEDCADRYYNKVIKTLTQLLKSSFTNRQTILINTTRSLKFLESYSNRQAKLWKVLSKYDKLPDHFHDLQVTLQMEFNLLKKATSKNTENLQDAVNLQQTCTTSLCSHINTIYSKLAKLEKQIQMHCLYPHSQTNIIRLNAPKYDSDIDGQLEVQVLPHANKTQESSPTPTNPDEDSALSQDLDRSESQPRPDQGPAEHQNTGAISEQGNSLPSLEDIPELEEEEEDWKMGNLQMQT